MNITEPKKVGKIAARIKELEPCPGVKLYARRTGTKDIITIVGSFPGGTGHTKERFTLARLCAEMLLEGTKKRSKALFHQALEARGIELSFSVSYSSLSFTLRTLTEELPVALLLLTEALMEPALESSALAIAKERLITSFHHDKTDTRVQARTALVQELYPRGHKNWSAGDDDLVRTTQAVSRADIVTFSKKYGLGEVSVVAVGDSDPEYVGSELRRAWKKMRRGVLKPLLEEKSALPRQAKTKARVIPGKTSIDVFLGQSLSMTLDHPDYYPLTLAMSVLGHGFTGRLMSHVRARDGLTYHTTAALDGFSAGAEGMWFAYGSFAPELYERGIEALRHEVNEFIARGITSEELLHRKTMLAGEHQVGLSTSRALAGTILSLVEDGRPLTLLDEYPEKFAHLTEEEVNTVIAKHLDVRTLVLSAAGTLPKSR